MGDSKRTTIIFGTAGFDPLYGFSNINRFEPEALVREALAYGVDTFDTAPVYGNAEAILGKSLRGRGKVWTKVTGANWKASLEQSLNRLSRTQVNLLQYHNWSHKLLYEQWFLGAWRALKSSGHCTWLGASTYGKMDAVAAVESDLFDVVQIEWNLLNQGVLKEVAPIAKRHRVRIAVRSIFLQGALTDEGRDLLGLPVLKAGVERARKLAAEFGVSLNALILESVLGHPDIDYVVIGFESIQQIQMAICTTGKKPKIETLDLGGHIEADPRNWTRI